MNNCILARFEKNNKTYIYYTFDNINICFGVLENNEILDTNSEEESFMKSIMHEIFISPDRKNHVDFGYIVYNRKKYKIMLDKISKLKYFLEVKDNILVEPDTEAIKELIYLYNDNSIINIEQMKDLYQEHKPIDYIRKIIDIGMVTISLIISLSSISKIQNYSGVLNDEIYLASKIFAGNNITYSQAVETIDSNPNIGDFEKKEFINNCQRFIEDNSQYFNEMHVKEKLRTFDLKYLETEEPDLLGEYNRIKNLILLFVEKKDFNIVFYHEMIHLFTPSILVGKGIDEGLTEMLSNEYFDKSTKESAYKDLCNINRILFEIIGTEPFLKFKFEGNERHLVDALCTIIPDEKKAYNLIAAIDALHIVRYKAENDKDRSLNEQTALITIYNSISDYYFAKYNRNIEEDIVTMKYLIDGCILAERQLYFEIDDVSVILYEVDKSYFNSELKSKNPNGVLITRHNYTKYNVLKSMKSGLPLKEVQERAGEIAAREGCEVNELRLVYSIVDGEEIVEFIEVLRISTIHLAEETPINEENRFYSSNYNSLG